MMMTDNPHSLQGLLVELLQHQHIDLLVGPTLMKIHELSDMKIKNE